MDDLALCRKVYAAAKAGTLNCADAFDLSTSVLEWSPAEEHATELASLSLECAPAGRRRMAELALTVLEATDFEPGFAEEPQWLTRLEDAMELVNRDVAATGLRHTCRLRVHPDEPALTGNAYAQTWDGHVGTSGGVYPYAGADPVSALLAVADDTQDAVMHSLWSAWPVCPAHQLGVHARLHHETAAWWCTGDDGHVVARIGEWQNG
ncbi:hypothetical protein [Paractinoplanes atraurantiacus]|uniref:Uncharacterized protein n=1 Tax=Paractinoplanes atraurantiacus TaxID=1036182 RepID=A0A285HRF3_9ACTN|nr:hypothetical protein [Actinoplanes atraurantiacus]SNY37301.1 hypothetical protein SAMN05421748_10573 [Actinoplanes atraurantiacus]